MTYILRTIDRQGDYIELARHACVIRACSTAELFSHNTVHGIVIVTDSHTRRSLSFVDGTPIR